MVHLDIAALDRQRPILIAGPTASGKSALALQIAERSGGVIINADAMQVFKGWPILSAQPSPSEQSRAAHALYGHIEDDATYSVGKWLGDLEPLLTGARPIIVGGTGLYFTALTQGLSPIPPVPAAIRERADGMGLAQLIADLPSSSLPSLDLANRARVQRAWEVKQATGRSLRDWHQHPGEPLLPLAEVIPLVLDAPREWLTPRIEARFDKMVQAGLLAEARAIRPNWSPDHPSSKTIGASALMELLRGEMSLDQVKEVVTIGSRQYAKRQRTWFRSRMGGWTWLKAASL